MDSPNPRTPGRSKWLQCRIQCVGEQPPASLAWALLLNACCVCCTCCRHARDDNAHCHSQMTHTGPASVGTGELEDLTALLNTVSLGRHAAEGPGGGRGGSGHKRSGQLATPASSAR
jgi:hypothetical protein